MLSLLPRMLSLLLRVLSLLLVKASLRKKSKRSRSREGRAEEGNAHDQGDEHSPQELVVKWFRKVASKTCRMLSQLCANEPES
jgi:hypothetical protein